MIGLIFGENTLPLEILKKIKRKRLKYLIIDLTRKNIFKKNINSYSASIGQFGKIINILKENNCKKVIFAGTVKRPNFSRLKLDLKGIYYMPKIIKSSRLGDAAILKEIIRILNSENIKTLNSLTFNSNLSLKRGNYSKLKPNRKDYVSIKKGIKYFNKLNELDHVQALIVNDGKIVAKEGREGTRKMLIKLKKKTHGILIKFPKKKQDLRIDLPTIGLQTIKDCKKYGLKGIVLKSKKNIILDKAKCIQFANKNRIFIKII